MSQEVDENLIDIFLHIYLKSIFNLYFVLLPTPFSKYSTVCISNCFCHYYKVCVVNCQSLSVSLFYRGIELKPLSPLDGIDRLEVDAPPQPGPAFTLHTGSLSVLESLVHLVHILSIKCSWLGRGQIPLSFTINTRLLFNRPVVKCLKGQLDYLRFSPNI